MTVSQPVSQPKASASAKTRTNRTESTRTTKSTRMTKSNRPEKKVLRSVANTGVKKRVSGRSATLSPVDEVQKKRISLVLVVWLTSVFSAFSVVYVTHVCRVKTQSLELLRREASYLNVESGRYMLERSSLSAYSRVETLASNELGMFVPENSSIVVVDQ